MSSPPTLVEKVRAQWRVLMAEMAKFGAVGVANTVIDFAVFNLLHFGAGVGPLTSQAVSTTISATASYFMNRHWTFRHRARTHIRREYTLFFILNLVGLAIMEVCIAVVRYGFGLTGAVPLNLAKVVGLVLGTLFRFWSYKRWVFLADDRLAADREPEESESDGPPEPAREAATGAASSDIVGPAAAADPAAPSTSARRR